MNDKNRNTGMHISAFAASVAVTLAAAIGLTAASEAQAPRPAASQTYRCTAADNKSAPEAPVGASNDEPELMRLDRASEHHG